jgi:hypothetical protein
VLNEIVRRVNPDAWPLPTEWDGPSTRANLSMQANTVQANTVQANTVQPNMGKGIR